MTSILTLMGPTATGKTELALQLAEHFPIEIISVDSALVFQEMDIGTAKPTQAMRAKVPHHLIDLIYPTETYSVARFLTDTRLAIAQIQAKGKIPLLVGGTMLYFKAWQEGLSDIPPVPPEVRRALRQACEEEGLPALYQRLKKIDPEAAARLSPHDAQRVLRALEVFEASGRPLSVWHAARPKEGVGESCLSLALIPEDRGALHAILARRFHQMLEAGFIEEVEQLRAKYALTSEHASMRSVGYRQVLAYLLGEESREDMCEKGIIASRQLAKRQLTWLRSWPNLQTVPAYQSQTLAQLVTIISKSLCPGS